MGLWDDIKSNVRKVILMEERLERLAIEQKAHSAQLINHNERLIRIETMIEMAQHGGNRRLPPE